MGGLLLLVILLGIYFVPAMVAGGRQHHQATAILMLNLFLGWTLLGWVVALVWACMNPPPAAAAVVKTAPPQA